MHHSEVGQSASQTPPATGGGGSARQVESSLSSYLAVLSRRKWIVIACALIVPITAYLVSTTQTKIYESTAEVYVNKSDIGSALTGIENQSLFIDEDRAAETQVNLASVPEVAKLALKNSGITDLTPDDVLAETSVSSKGLSDIIEIAVDDPDPALARKLASAYALAFTQYRGQLDGAAITTARREVDRKLKQLEDEGKTDTKLYDSLSESEQQLATLETLKTSRTSVVRDAEEAVQIAPTPVRNAILGLVLGLVLGVGLAFALDALDTRVRSTSEIADLLGMTLLARLPEPPKDIARSDELVMHARPQGTQAEAFRMLRTNLEFARLEGTDVRTILVTSAVEEEGKSTTASNLAIAMARSGSRVALVDLDLRRPYLHRFFDLIHAKGVTDVALGQSSVEGALATIDTGAGLLLANGIGPEENANHGVLHVMPSGPLPPDPGEFAGTVRLAKILADLRATHDIVIIDSPPILRVGDAMAMSAQTDGIVVVTRLKVVRRPILRELRRVLDTTPVPKLGFVVTGGDDDDPYGSAYGYRYGYGYGEKPDGKRSKAEAGTP